MTTTNRLEALADCIASLHNYSDPESESYQLRNPGMLEAKTFHELNKVNDAWKRQFTSHIAGYQALLDHIKKQCKWHKRKPVKELLAHFGFTDQLNLTDALSYLRRSLKQKKLELEAPLSFFLEK